MGRSWTSARVVLERALGLGLLLGLCGCGAIVVGFVEGETETETTGDGGSTTDTGTTSSTSTTTSADAGSSSGEPEDPFPDYVAVGDVYSIVVSYDDGLTWTERTEPDAVPEDVLFSAVRGGDLLVAVGGEQTFVSTDGETWTGFASSLGWASAVTFGDAMFVSVGWDRRSRSVDAMGWIDERAGELELNYADIAHGNGRFVAVGKGGISTSTDGENWTSIVSPEPPLVAVTHFNGQFVLVGHQGRVSITENGTDFLSDEVLGGSDFGNICVYQGRLVASIYDGALRVSDDGTDWAETAVPGVNRVACGETSLVAAGGTTLYRGESIVDMQEVRTTTQTLFGVRYTGG